MTGTIDLHTHSTASDGLLSPAALVDEARRRGLSVLGLTDHDTVDGLDAAAKAAELTGLTVVPGVELSAEENGFEIHLLGYYVDAEDQQLRAELAELARRRVARITRIVERLGQLGIHVELDRVFALAGDGTVGRPHVARALVERGYVEDVGQAFDRYLATGRPAYVPRANFTPEDALALLLRARAVPVLAHPFTAGDVTGVINRLVPGGLLGIEVYYGEYLPEVRVELGRIADAHGLIPTGGSDYHGPNYRSGRELGSAPVPEASFTRLGAAAERLAAKS